MKNQPTAFRTCFYSLCMIFFSAFLLVSTGCQKEISEADVVSNERGNKLSQLPEGGGDDDPFPPGCEYQNEPCNYNVTWSEDDDGAVNVTITDNVDHLQYWNENTQQMEWICAPEYYGQNVPPCEPGSTITLPNNPSGTYGISASVNGENVFCQYDSNKSEECDQQIVLCNEECIDLWIGDLVIFEVDEPADGTGELLFGVDGLAAYSYRFTPPAGQVGNTSITIRIYNFDGDLHSETTYCFTYVDCN